MLPNDNPLELGVVIGLILSGPIKKGGPAAAFKFANSDRSCEAEDADSRGLKQSAWLAPVRQSLVLNMAEYRTTPTASQRDPF